MENIAVAKGPQNNTPHKKHDATHPSGLASVEMSLLAGFGSSSPAAGGAKKKFKKISNA